GPDVADQAIDRVEGTAELFSQGRALGVAAPGGDALVVYGHGATFRRRRHLRLRSVSQLQEARKPTSTRVSHLLSTRPIQTARYEPAVSLADPAGSRAPAVAWGTARCRRPPRSASRREVEREHVLAPHDPAGVGEAIAQAEPAR